MSRIECKPRRSLRQEIYSVAIIFLISLILVLVFPYAVFSFAATPQKDSRASCAFVTLSDEAYANAISSTRVAWKVAPDIESHSQFSLSALPREEHSKVITSFSREKNNKAKILEIEKPPFLPSCAASSPIKIKSEKTEINSEPFPREKLLLLPPPAFSF